MAERQVAGPADATLALAENRYADARKGGGVNDDRIIEEDYTALDGYRARGMIMRVAVPMHPPNNKGVVDMTTEPMLMPADKYQKWFGRGFRPVNYVEPVPAPPTRWLPSMVEEAIAEGKPIPEELRPQGYIGPTFVIKRDIQELEANPLEQTDALPIGKVDVGPEVFYCSDNDCARFFDSAQGKTQHERTAHRKLTTA
jgi:hypothetical protein